MAESKIQKYSEIKSQFFSVTGTTETQSIAGGWYKGSAILPTVNGTVLGVSLRSVLDTDYGDRYVFAVPAKYGSGQYLTLWGTSPNRGIRAEGYILYV